MTQYKLNPAKLMELIEARKLNSIQSQQPSAAIYSDPSDPPGFLDSIPNSNSNLSETTDKYGQSITYNSKQQEFINLTLSGKSCVLIGAAGTGKTTCQKGATTALIQSNNIPLLRNHNHKYLPDNVPGIVICAFTRRATNNIRRNVSADMQGNCITIHKLLEYQPEYYEIYDSATGKEKKTMRFVPSRHQDNPLPDSIKVIIFEESSMISTALHQEVINAASSDCQFIYLGDIQQLPPVFGSAILGYKLLELPVVELTEVYRQAFDSPIIKLAHRILSGNAIPKAELTEWNIPGKLKIHPWQKRISPDSATLTLAKLFIKLLDESAYNPETDAILIPFNKSCGTDELNKHIANKIAKKEGKIVYEIIHGFKKSYYSIGDKCLYDREDAIIQNIYTNPEYSGAIPQTESTSLDYWGHKKRDNSDGHKSSDQDDIDFLLRQVAAPQSEEDETVRAASHVVELYLLDSDRTINIKTTGDLNSLILGYALTVHKAQGSEWDRVYLCFHQSHAVMIQRELLYTAVTRAKKELVIICEDDTFVKGIENQRIKGNSLEEKAIWFKGRLDSKEAQT